MYIMEILMKLPKDLAALQSARQLLQQQVAILGNDRELRSVVVQFNVDPL